MVLHLGEMDASQLESEKCFKSSFMWFFRLSYTLRSASLPISTRIVGTMKCGTSLAE